MNKLEMFRTPFELRNGIGDHPDFQLLMTPEEKEAQSEELTYQEVLIRAGFKCLVEYLEWDFDESNDELYVVDGKLLSERDNSKKGYLVVSVCDTEEGPAVIYVEDELCTTSIS